MDITQYEFEIKRHAFIRAMERHVSPDMIEATLKSGRIERFAKNGIKFHKEYKNCTVICVGEIMPTKIKIITIETQGEGR